MPYELVIRSATRRGDMLDIVFPDGTGMRLPVDELKALARHEPDKDWLIAQALRRWAETDPDFQSVTSVANKKISVTIAVGPA